MGPSAQITLDSLEISGAADTGSGHGVLCDGSTGAGVRSLRLVNDVIANNRLDGVFANTCEVVAIQTAFSANGASGAELIDSHGSFDRCTINNNPHYGLYGDGALYDLTNSFVYRNGKGLGVYTFPDQPGSVIAFNTVVDNSVGVECNANPDSPVTLPNNILARNTTDTTGASCTYPGSIIMADVAAPHFVQPDVAPYDYHITAGSIAIDQATASTVDHDFDGDPRPKGNGRDIGADEAQ